MGARLALASPLGLLGREPAFSEPSEKPETALSFLRCMHSLSACPQSSKDLKIYLFYLLCFAQDN